MHDFIVVGAGSSGCVIARRLIDAGKKVLLIESGPLKKETANIEKIEGFPNLWGSSYDWNYSTIPQNGLSERVININQGKVVGGSGSINAMMFVKGHKSNYEQLIENGGDFWNSKNLNNCLSKIENYIDGPSEGRYQSGMVQVRNCPDATSYSPEFQQSAKSLGYATDDWDYNGPVQSNGAGPLQFNIDEKGNRHSPFKAYLESILKNKNLEIISNTYVKRILMHNKIANGVELIFKDDSIKKITCKNKIIICAGAIGSPILLERSGIGDSKNLNKANIPQKVDAPSVGENLMDHLQLPVLFKLKKQLPNPKLLTGNVLFADLNQNSPYGAPDLQLNFTPAAPQPLQRLLPPLEFPVMIFLPILVQPLSVGSVHWDGEKPNLDPNYLNNEKDVEVFKKAIKLCNDMASAPGLNQLASDALLPPPEGYEDYIRGNATTIWHPVGTCRIGKEPSDSVVNSELEVHGVKNLHVVDSSVTPYVTSGNNHVLALVMGEMASEILLNSA
tara:strand:- start:2355 stop:3863 length:1509 start_codon:yes stop_codon:yes gene_type:complete